MIRLIITMMLVIFSPVVGGAAFFPLEITNIKPAGTGNPAIPETNRIFRAYPGIEYNIRAAVIGGVYPYTYSLSNAPSGMTINASTGEITWTNPQSNSGTITLSVTDSDTPEETTVSTTWAITVSESGFIFVDADYAEENGTENGSITRPYSDLTNLLDNESTTTDIVYFSGGTYQMVDFNSANNHVMRIDSNPTTWLAYPEESVTLQGGSANSTQAHRMTIFSTFYFDGLTIKDSVDYAILTESNYSYKTIRNCIFDGLVPSTSENHNYGFVHTGNDGPGYYFVIQDSEFKNWRNASAIGSLYNDKKMLIENNYIHSDLASGSPSGIGSTNGISPKYYTDYLTVRGNMVVMAGHYPLGGNNAAFIDSDYNEICFNVFHKTDGGLAHLFDWEVGQQLTTYYWRNTLIGYGGPRSTNSSGPYTFSNNVVINSNSFSDAYNYWLRGDATTVTLSDNLTNTTATNLIDPDDDYKLIESQSAYVGSRGWQFSDGSTPLDGSFVPTCEDGVWSLCLTLEDCEADPPGGWWDTANEECLAEEPGSPVNGACGSNDGATLSSLTSGNSNNCANGTTVDNFTGTGPWTWDCVGLNGGTTEYDCEASLASQVAGALRQGAFRVGGLPARFVEATP
jgi:hypothetical protein